MSDNRKKGAAIEIECVGKGEPTRFKVVVREDQGISRHEVTLSQDMCERLSSGGCEATEIIEAAFRFLLAREAKESILANFDVNVISRYFPEFEEELPSYFARLR
jgi:hypothetical protein